MGLGENPPQLVSEKEHRLLKNNWATFSEKNREYVNDESVPPAMYSLIEQYREKARSQKPGNDLALIIDDFFGESNAILKDQQLREIARIRNENNVEVTKLKKVIEGKAPFNYTSMAKDNLSVASKKKDGSMFVDNEVERQRRQLIQENETIKSRLRACENLLKSGTAERVKFMEGASWIANKAKLETDHHQDRVQKVMQEFQERTSRSVKNESLKDFDGNRVAENKEWICNELVVEARDLSSRFQHMFENVNYQLSNAVKDFS